MLIRNATELYAEAIGNLHAASWRDAYRGILSDEYLDRKSYADRLAFWRRRFREESGGKLFVRVAEEEGMLLGFVCVVLDADTRWGALLDNLHIRPDARGRGLGRRLMAEAAAWVHGQRPGSPMHLWVFEQNRQAVGFYESLGGEMVERVLKPAVDGSNVVSLRYLWRDLSTLKLL
jgi:GNAT superfamily N-acetyltransferase